MYSHPRQLFALVAAWFLIELLACSFATIGAWRSLQHCELSGCETNDPAMFWDSRRGFAAVVAVQLVQAIGSAMWLAALGSSEARGAHVGKAILVGAAMVVISGLIGWFVYQRYPRPQYWSLGNMFVEVFITVPVLQGLSALLGGIVCGMMDWKFRQTA